MQWLYFDALECLAEDEGVMLTEEECTPVGVDSKSHTEDRCMRMTVVLNCFSFSLSLFPEKLSIRWADCSVWHQAAGFACQTALFPGELSIGNLSNITYDMLLLREF